MIPRDQRANMPAMRSNPNAGTRELLKLPVAANEYGGDNAYVATIWAGATISYPVEGVTIGGVYQAFETPATTLTEFFTEIEKTLSGAYFNPVVDVYDIGSGNHRIAILAPVGIESIRFAGTDDADDATLTDQQSLNTVELFLADTENVQVTTSSGTDATAVANFGADAAATKALYVAALTTLLDGANGVEAGAQVMRVDVNEANDSCRVIIGYGVTLDGATPVAWAVV